MGFLKQLDSGLLLVSGPYKVNGVPLRRLNQAYVIATSTKVNISSVAVPARVNDDYFKRKAAPKKAEGEEFFDGETAKRTPLPAERKEDQQTVDKALMKAISKQSMLKEYLTARFSLRQGQYPHLMQF